VGRVLDIGVDVAYRHEGYAAHVLQDGTLTGTYSAETRPLMTGKLRAACACDWSGSEVWDVDSDDPADWPSEELEDNILREWQVHVHGLVHAKQTEDADALMRTLRGFARNADDLAAAKRGDGDETAEDVLKRIRGNLQYAATLVGDMTTEED
jgi:hypothetical protein